MRLVRFLPLLLLFISCEVEKVIVKPEEKKGTYEEAQSIFDETKLPEINIKISLDEWNSLLEKYDADDHTPEYVRCDEVRFERDDETLTVKNVGLRLKGNTSRRRPEGWKGEEHKTKDPHWRRVHFGLNCRKFSEEGSFDGIRRINLKYAKDDATYVREHYSYDLLSRYGVWTAPMTSWCRLNFKIGADDPVYYGVYLMIESIDMRYVKRRQEQFGSADGWLWKCAWGANLKGTDSWRFHHDNNLSKSYPYELKNGELSDFANAKSQLLGFISKLNRLQGDELKEWLNKVCDVDLLLKMYAVYVAIGHWDDYWNNMNNFYLYFNSRDMENYKVFMLPYDLDNTLGTSHNVGVQNDSGRQDPYHWGSDDQPFIAKVLSVSEFRAKYTEYLRDFSTADNPWTGQAASAERIRTWQKLFADYVSNDTGEDMTLKDVPASWGNHSEYRLLENNSNNWFKVKAESINKWLDK